VGVRPRPVVGAPYDSTLNTLLNEPAFKELANGRVNNVAKKIQLAGNKAVHEAKPPAKLEAVEVVSSLFHFCLWLAVTYGRDAKPDPGLIFNPHGLMDHGKAEKASLAERQELEERLEREAEEAELARQRERRADPDGRGVGGRAAGVARRGGSGEEGGRGDPG
jgi:type I restriction enzyme R subunit